jgi:hypothetical protein
MRRELILPELRGGLWHTTHPLRFKSILLSGAILPEPEIPNAERFGSAAGRENYPYVRFLGGVSLFDLDQFDPAEYQKRCPSSSWAYFIPHHLDWTCAVWIEIDREQVAPKLISARDLVLRWKTDGAYGHNIMPEIEAAYVENLPVAAFKRAFLVCEDDDNFHSLPLDASSLQIDQFSRTERISNSEALKRWATAKTAIKSK